MNAYYHRNIEALRARENARRAANPEGHRQTNKKYREEHPEYKRAAYRRNRDKILESQRAQRERIARDYPELLNARNIVMHARKLAKGRPCFTESEWLELKARYGGHCLWCGKAEPEVRICCDHVMPVSLGGACTIDNIQPLCGSCNSRKNNRHMDFRSASAS